MDIKFRKESLESNTNNNNKKFISILPVKSLTNFSFILFFLIFIVLCLFYIQIPKKVKTIGFVDIKNDLVIYSDYEQFSLVYNFNNLNRKNKKGDVLFYLKSNKINKDIIEKLSDEISIKQKLRTMLLNEYETSINDKDELIEKQKEIVEQILEKIKLSDEMLVIKKEAYNKGLINLDELNSYKQELNNTRLELTESKKNLSFFEIDKKQNKINYEKFKIELDNNIAEIKTKIEFEKNKNLIEIRSPCECQIKKIYIDNNGMVEKGHPIVSFSSHNIKNKKAILFIKSSDITDILNKKVNLTFDSYPFLKYGSVSSSVDFVSSETIKHPFLEQNNFSGNYFLIETELMNINNDVILSDGMSVKGDIIIENKPLYKFLFKEIF